MDLCIQRFLLLEVYFTTFLSTISNQSLPKNAKNVVSASYPDDYPDVSLSNKMPSVPFPWSLAVHHQSLATGWLYMPPIPENQVLRDRRRGGARGALLSPPFCAKSFVRKSLHNYNKLKKSIASSPKLICQSPFGP